MPMTEVVWYDEGDGTAPALEWLDEQPQKVQDKMIVAVGQLAEHGSTLKRPTAAPLRDKIYELRVGHMRVNYRLLYFFHGKGVAVLAHGCTKEKEVPNADINRAIQRRNAFQANPDLHTHRVEEEG